MLGFCLLGRARLYGQHSAIMTDKYVPCYVCALRWLPKLWTSTGYIPAGQSLLSFRQTARRGQSVRSSSGAARSYLVNLPMHLSVFGSERKMSPGAWSRVVLRLAQVVSIAFSSGMISKVDIRARRPATTTFFTLPVDQSTYQIGDWWNVFFSQVARA